MSKAKKMMTAAGTFTAALSIGFVMQYGDALASRFTAEPPGTSGGGSLDLPTDLRVSASLAMPEVSLPASAPVAEIVLAAVEDTSTDIMTPGLIVPLATDAADCTVRVTAETAPGAFVSLGVQAPCHQNAGFTVHHQGMMFSAVTDAKGSATYQVPALSERAVVMVSFDDGDGAVAATEVPELAMYDRAVLQWQGTRAVQLHALEFGATYGDPGHIWMETTGTTDLVAIGAGGLLTRLGEPSALVPFQAEVYTFPSGMAARDGQVILNVEAEITADNCGQDISAQSIQIAPGQPSHAVDLSMTLPACDAVGEYLVLKNMFEDLTLAAR